MNVDVIWDMVQEIPPPTILLPDYQSLLFRPESIFARLHNNEEIHICYPVVMELTNLAQMTNNFGANLAIRALAKIEEFREHPKVVIQSGEESLLIYDFDSSVNEDSDFEDKIIANFWLLMWTGGKLVKLVVIDEGLKTRASEEGLDLFDIQDLDGSNPPMER